MEKASTSGAVRASAGTSRNPSKLGDIVMQKIVEMRKAEKAKGKAVSTISIFIPSDAEIKAIRSFITNEIYFVNRKCKAHSNKTSILEALSAVNRRLNFYPKPPLKGLTMYCLTSVESDGSVEVVNTDYQASKDIANFMFILENVSYKKVLTDLPNDDNQFGFIIIDDKWSALFGILQGKIRKVVFEMEGNGEPYEHMPTPFVHFMKRISRKAMILFMKGKRKNITGLVLGMNRHMKSQITNSVIDEALDPKLWDLLLLTVEVLFTGECGLNEAVELSRKSIQNYKSILERKVILRYIKEINENTGKYCFGADNTLRELKLRNVETLICWENLKIYRFMLINRETSDEIIIHSLPEQEKNLFFHDKNVEDKFELKERQLLLEWLSNNYKSYGAKLVTISDKSSESTLLQLGFNGIGALLLN